MSRIGKMPIKVPSGVKVTILEDKVEVEGNKVKLSAYVGISVFRFRLSPWYDEKDAGK